MGESFSRYRRVLPSPRPRLGWQKVLASFATVGLLATGIVVSTPGKASASGCGTLVDVDGVYQVENEAQLRAIRTCELDKEYRLTVDIDLTGKAEWTPIGASASDPFTGSFDGGGHTITGLTVNGSGSFNQGMFGVTNNAEIRNLTLNVLTITARSQVGGLVGSADNTAITDVEVSGQVQFEGNYVGGLIGLANAVTVSKSAANVDVTRKVDSERFSERVGGFIGELGGDSLVTKSFAKGNVTVKHTGSDTTRVDTKFGGFVGLMNGGTISYSFSEGDVEVSGPFTGGFQAHRDVGGFAGAVGGTIKDSYSRGDVTQVFTVDTQNDTSGEPVGGFTGRYTEVIRNSFSTGKVEANRVKVGFAPTGSREPLNSFWDTTTSGISSSAGGTGKATNEMKSPNTFSVWGNILDEQTWEPFNPANNKVWGIDTRTDVGSERINDGYPFLLWQVESNPFKTEQTITFDSDPPVGRVSGDTYPPSATASSGLPVSFTIADASSSVCSIDGGVVTFNTSGECVVQADQAGNDEFAAADRVTQTVTVEKIPQEITFPDIADQSLRADPFFAGASVNNDDVGVTYESDTPSTCTVVEATGSVTVSDENLGTCSITASAEGDAVYSAATPVTRAFQVVETVPDAPTIVPESFGDGEVTLEFSPPSFTGGAAITGYQAVATADGGGAPVVEACETTSPCVVTGLTNGVSYTVTLAAVNSVGVGALSEPSGAVVPAAAPDGVSDLGVAFGDQQLTVSWTGPAALGGGGFDRYEVFIRVAGTTDWGTARQITVITETQSVFESLVNGTEYEFQVLVVTEANDTELKSEVAEASGIPLTTPDAPTIDDAVFGDEQITVLFSAPEVTGGTPITGYQAVATPDVGGAPVVEACETTSPCVVTGLTNGVSYTVTLAAVNSVGVGALSEPSGAVVPAKDPDGVSGLVVVPDSEELTVSWESVTGLGGGEFVRHEVSLRVVGDTSWGDPRVITDVGVTSTVFVELSDGTGLTNGVEYEFQIVTFTTANATELVSPAVVVAGMPVTPPGAVTGLSVEATSPTTATVTWVAPVDDGGAEVSGYLVTPACSFPQMTATTCFLTGLKPGSTVRITVSAVNIAGAGPSVGAAVRMPVVPEERADHTGIHLDFQAEVGDLVEGSSVVIGGQGLFGHSDYSLVVRSTPQVLSSGSASLLGNFSIRVTMPALSEGNHSLTLTALSIDGSPLVLVQRFSVDREGRVATVGSAVGGGFGGLVSTGPSSVALSWGVGVSTALVVVGFGAYMWARRGGPVTTGAGVSAIRARADH